MLSDMVTLKKYNIELLLTVALGFSIYSLYTTGNDGAWFSRSGSIMVLLSVIAEFQVNVARESSVETSSTVKIGGSGVMVKRELSPRYKVLAIIAHLEIVLGTIVWGYGDCLFKSCN